MLSVSQYAELHKKSFDGSALPITHDLSFAAIVIPP
jgi:hypothetical protein